MRLFNYLIIILIGGVILLVSCKKNIPSEITDAKVLVTSFKDTSSGVSIEDFVVDPGDVDHEEFNEAMAAIGAALMHPIISDTLKFRSTIYQKVLSADNHEAYLHAILANSDSLEEVYNNALADELGENPATFNYLSWTENNYVYDTSYLPVLYVPNADLMDTSKMPIVALGLQLPDDNYSWADDHIPAWIYESGTYRLFAMNESFAMNTNHPVVILSNTMHHGDENEAPNDIHNYIDADYNGGGGSSGPGGGSGNCPQNGVPHYYNVKFKVNYAYERDGKSEANLVLVDYRAGVPKAFEWIKKIDNNTDLGTWISYYQFLFAYSSNLTSGNVDISNQEYDWYAGLKPLGNVFVGQSTSFVWDYYGRRKFFHEFYNLTDHIPGYDWFTALPCDGDIYIESNIKGANEFTRIDK